MVLRFLTTLLLVILVLCGCADRLKTKDQVQEAIMHRLRTSTGLDINSLDVTTTSVTFDKNKAFATVAFHPKDDPALNSGMTMRYTLEERNGKWVVVNVGDSQGHGLPGSAAAGADNLPPGHPPVNSAMPDAAAEGMSNPHALPSAQGGDQRPQ